MLAVTPGAQRGCRRSARAAIAVAVVAVEGRGGWRWSTMTMMVMVAEILSGVVVV